MLEVKTVSIGLKVYPPAIILASFGAAPNIIPFKGTLPSGAPPPVGHSVMQLAPIQNPAADDMLPLDFMVPSTSKLSVVGAMPIPNLLPGVMPKVMVDVATVNPFNEAPLVPKDKDVPPADSADVLLTESILKNSVPVALVILNRFSLSANGVTVTGL